MSIVVKSGIVRRILESVRNAWNPRLLLAGVALAFGAYIGSRGSDRENPYQSASTQQLITTVYVGQGMGQSAVGSFPDGLSHSLVSAEVCAGSAGRIDGVIPLAMHRVVHAPYVVTGNMPEEELDGWYHRVIAPAAYFLHHTYDQPLPAHPICIVLLRDEESYRTAVEALFGTQHVSIYGFYHPRHRILLVNLEGGAGTLLHELTHAVIGENYPALPLWLNEGIASLYESCELLIDSDRVRILPKENWRRQLLEEHLEAGTLPSIQSLYFRSRFQGEDEALDYALARYWCYFLAERGQLSELYRQMRLVSDSDPTGSMTLRGQFRSRSWQEIDADFQSWLERPHLSKPNVKSKLAGRCRYDR